MAPARARARDMTRAALTQCDAGVVDFAVVDEADLAIRCGYFLIIERGANDPAAHAAGIGHGNLISGRTVLIGEFKSGPFTRNARINRKSIAM